MSTAPGWITPGTRVVVHTYGSAASQERVTADTIKSVAAKSFRLEKADARFPIDTQRADTSTYGPISVVHPLDSDVARRLVVAENARRRVRAADRAFDEWRKTRTPEARAAAIAALQAIEESP